MLVGVVHSNWNLIAEELLRWKRELASNHISWSEHTRLELNSIYLFIASIGSVSIVILSTSSSTLSNSSLLSLGNADHNPVCR